MTTMSSNAHFNSCHYSQPPLSIMRTAAFLLRVHDQFCEQVQPYASFSCGKEIYVQEYGFKALARLNSPVPVFLKRLAAALRVSF